MKTWMNFRQAYWQAKESSMKGIHTIFYAPHIWEKNKAKLRKYKKVNFGKDKLGKPKAAVFILFVVIHSGEDKT